jgi:hypothetical protein
MLSTLTDNSITKYIPVLIHNTQPTHTAVYILSLFTRTDVLIGSAQLALIYTTILIHHSISDFLSIKICYANHIILYDRSGDILHYIKP